MAGPPNVAGLGVAYLYPTLSTGLVLWSRVWEVKSKDMRNGDP